MENPIKMLPNAFETVLLSSHISSCEEASYYEGDYLLAFTSCEPAVPVLLYRNMFQCSPATIGSVIRVLVLCLVKGITNITDDKLHHK